MNAAAAVAEQDDRAEWHLWNWSQWMRKRPRELVPVRDKERESGYPSRGMGGLGCSGASDFDSMCAAVDTRCAAATDALIDDLPQPERLAIYNRWIANVFRFRDGEDRAYKAGKTKIGRGLWARGIW